MVGSLIKLFLQGHQVKRTLLKIETNILRNIRFTANVIETKERCKRLSIYRMYIRAQGIHYELKFYS